MIGRAVFQACRELIGKSRDVRQHPNSVAPKRRKTCLTRTNGRKLTNALQDV